MQIITRYQHYDEDTQQYVTTFIPENKYFDSIIYTLVAEQNKYLYNIKTQAIRSAITIPSFMKNDWEERAYK